VIDIQTLGDVYTNYDRPACVNDNHEFFNRYKIKEIPEAFLNDNLLISMIHEVENT